MAGRAPFISTELRPSVSIDVDRERRRTLAELRAALASSMRDIDDLLGQESEQKDNTKDKSDKEQSDLKAQQDHKDNVDKQAADHDASRTPGMVQRTVLELLSRILAESGRSPE